MSGTDGNTVKSDLSQAMDLLIPEIIAEEFGTSGRNGRVRRSRRLRVIADTRKKDGWRRLAVEFTGDTPTTVDNVEDIREFILWIGSFVWSAV